jgi:hypothetical protein
MVRMCDIAASGVLTFGVDRGAVCCSECRGAHADVCDLNEWLGHLASFGLREAEGPGAKLASA